MLMKPFLLLACLAAAAETPLTPPCQGGENEPGTPPPRISLTLTGRSDDGPRIASELTGTFLTPPAWQAYVARFLKKFENWHQDTTEDIGRYLNDRLVIVALDAIGGEAPKIQGAVAYLALYREFHQPVPSLVQDFLREHPGSMGRLLRDFTWEKASDFVKNRRYREDIAERKRAKLGTAMAPSGPRSAGGGPPGPACLQLLSLDWPALTQPDPETPVASK